MRQKIVNWDEAEKYYPESSAAWDVAMSGSEGEYSIIMQFDDDGTTPYVLAVIDTKCEKRPSSSTRTCMCRGWKDGSWVRISELG